MKILNEIYMLFSCWYASYVSFIFSLVPEPKRVKNEFYLLSKGYENVEENNGKFEYTETVSWKLDKGEDINW